MSESDGDVFFDSASRDAEFGGDVGMGHAVYTVATKDAHRTLGRAGQRSGQPIEPLATGDRVESGGRIVDRLHTDDRRRRVDIANVATLTTAIRTDTVEHDVHADAVQIR